MRSWILTAALFAYAAGTSGTAGVTDALITGDGAALEVVSGIDPAWPEIRIEKLPPSETPALPPGMVNVTAGGGAYRFLPPGMTFEQPVRVHVPLASELVDAGAANSTAARTYFWDEQRDRWVPLPKVALDLENSRLVSETTHFTTMINGILTAPDNPPPLAFNPNSIKDFAAADPNAGIDLIEPPRANNRGTAELSYPIRLPEGRGAYTPTLELTYSSARGAGWVGYGWDLSMSQISVDTRWGVPAYKGDERYLLDGSPLVPIPTDPLSQCNADPGALIVKQYSTRLESHRRILLCSSSGDRYWEVTDKSGIRFEYGFGSAEQLRDYSVQGQVSHIAVWFLSKVVDPNGNVTLIGYETDKSSPDYEGEPYVQLYLSELTYTSHPGSQIPAGYRASFKRECAKTGDYGDLGIQSSGRTGFKVLTRCQLTQIDVKQIIAGGDLPIRSYEFHYNNRKKFRFGKSLLEKVVVNGSDGSEFYSYGFEYTDPIHVSEAPAPFTTDSVWPAAETNALDPSDSLLGKTDEVGNSGSLGVGVSVTFELGTAKAGCDLSASARIDLDEPVPEVQHVDLNGDRIPDRLWLSGEGVRVQLGSSDEHGGAYGGATGAETARNLRHLGKQKTLGGAGGLSASCSAEAGGARAGVSAGLSFSHSVTGANSVLSDVDGDGLLDLAWRGAFLRGLPGSCRDGEPPPDNSCPGTVMGRCSDGLLACKDGGPLCFSEKVRIAGDANLDFDVCQASAAPKSDGEQLRKAEVSPIHAAEAFTRKLEPETAAHGTVQLAMLDDLGLIAGLSPLANAFAQEPELFPPPELRQASGRWGAYSALTSRLQEAAKESPPEGSPRQIDAGYVKNHQSVIRWDAPLEGTVAVNVRVRRKYLADRNDDGVPDANAENGLDGAVIRVVHVKDPRFVAGTAPLTPETMLAADEMQMLEVFDGAVGVGRNDSILVMVDGLEDVPVAPDGTPLEAVNVQFQINYSEVCDIGPEFRLGQERCRTLEPSDLTRTTPTGELAYSFEFPRDFRTSELPRMAYWQPLPPLALDARNRIIGRIEKKEATATPVRVRIRCEPLTADPQERETYTLSTRNCFSIGDILWQHTFAPDDVGAIDLGEEFDIRLPYPFLPETALSDENDYVLVSGPGGLQTSYRDFDTIDTNILILNDAAATVAERYFPLATHDVPGPLTLLSSVSEGLIRGVWDAALVTRNMVDPLTHEVFLRLPDGREIRRRLFELGACCPNRSAEGLGTAGRKYTPIRILVEIDGTNGFQISPDAVDADVSTRIVSLQELEDSIEIDPESLVLVVSRAQQEHDAASVESLDALNRYNLAHSGGQTPTGVLLWDYSQDDLREYHRFVNALIPDGNDFAYSDLAQPSPITRDIAITKFFSALHFLSDYWCVTDNTCYDVKLSAGIIKYKDYLYFTNNFSYKSMNELSHFTKNENVDLNAPDVEEASDLFFICCGSSSILQQISKTRLLVRDKRDVEKVLDIRSYESIGDGQIGVIKGNVGEILAPYVFAHARTLEYASVEEARRGLLAAEVAAIYADGETLARIINDPVRGVAYLCCPREQTEAPMSIVSSVKSGALIDLSGKPLRQRLPILYRVHPSRQLKPFLTTAQDQELEVTVHRRNAANPLTVTVWGEELDEEIGRIELPAVSASSQPATFPARRERFTLPEPGMYYVRGYTEAEFRTDNDTTDESPAYPEIVIEAALLGVELKFLLSEAASDVAQNYAEVIRHIDAGVPIFVLEDSPGLEYVQRVLPWRMSQAVIFSTLDDVEAAIAAGIRNADHFIVLLERRFVDYFVDLLGNDLRVCCDNTWLAGRRPVETNRLRGDFGNELYSPARTDGSTRDQLSEPMDLVGEVPYSLEQWFGGYQSFYYGLFTERRPPSGAIGGGPTCIGFLPCQDLVYARAGSPDEHEAVGEAVGVGSVETLSNPNGSGGPTTASRYRESWVEPSGSGKLTQLPSSGILQAGWSVGSASRVGEPYSRIFRRHPGILNASGHFHDCPGLWVLLGWQCADDDRDGIPNQIVDRRGEDVLYPDQCPGVPEDLDGFEDHDGCPELDGPNPYAGNPQFEPPECPVGSEYCDKEWAGVRMIALPPGQDGDINGPDDDRLFGDSGVYPGGPGLVPSHGGRGGDRDGGGDGNGGSPSLGDTVRRSSNFGVNASTGANVSGVVGNLGVNASVGFNSSYTDQEFIDWNGDGQPDLVAPGEVQLTGTNELVRLNIECLWPPGARPDVTGEKCLLYPAVHQSETTTGGLGLSGGAGGQVVGHKATPGGRTKEQGLTGSVSNGISVNAQASHSSIETNLLDINGDGLPDVVSTREENGEIHLIVRLNLGYRVGEWEDWGGLGIDGAASSLFVRFFDFGSSTGSIGRTDNLTTGINKSAGGGFSLASIIGFSLHAAHSDDVTAAVTNFAFADINGDGLPDLLVKSPEEQFIRVRYNRGGTLGDNDTFLLGDSANPEALTLACNPNCWQRAPSVPAGSGDFLGVASWLNDALNSDLDAVYLSGSDTENISGTLSAKFLFITLTASYYHKWGHGFTELGLYDVTGDGLPDRVLRQGGEGNAAIQVQRNNLGRANLLHAIDNPLGGRTVLEYEFKAPTAHDPTPRWVLAATTVSGAMGTHTDPLVERHQYERPHFDRYEKEFRGYEMVRTIRGEGPDGKAVAESTFHNRDFRLQGRLKSIAYFDVSRIAPDGTVQPVRPLQELSTEFGWKRLHEGSAERAACLNAFGPVLPVAYLGNANTVLDAAGLTPCDVWFVRPERKTTTWCEGLPDSQCKTTSITYDQYDDFGNVVAMTDLLDEGTADDVVARLEYEHDGGGQEVDFKAKHIVDRVRSLHVSRKSDGAALRHTEATYDERGNLDVHSVFADAGGASKATLDLDYNATGFLTKVTDTNGYSVQYKPDPVVHQFTVETEDNLQLKSTTDYDYRYQLPVRHVDVNGNPQVMAYDTFGRLTHMWGPYEEEAASTSPTDRQKFASLDVQYSLPAQPRPAYALSTNRAVDPASLDTPTPKVHTTIRTVSFLDGLGRSIQTQTDSEVGGEFGFVVSGPVKFDSLGRKVRQGHPDFIKHQNPAADPIVLRTVAPQNETVWQYDALDRPLRIEEPGNGQTVRVTQMDYTIGTRPRDVSIKTRRTKVTDPKGKIRFDHHDAVDRLAAVVQRLDGRDVTTSYSYLPTGELVAILDAHGNETTLEYDLAGRRTAVTTPDTGRLELGYDDNGNLIERTDQELCKNQPTALLDRCGSTEKIRLVYEADSNRLKTIDYPALPDVTFTYGDADPAGDCADLENTRGRVCRIDDGAGAPDSFERKSYGALGEIVTMERTTRGAPWETGNIRFTTSLVYDSFGRMLSLRYPDGEVLTYGYDLGGQVSSIKGDKAGAPAGYPTDYVRDIRYDEFGQRTRIELGNGVVHSFAYDPETRWLEREIIAMKAPDTKRDISYQYDDVGNIELVTDDRGAAQPGHLAKATRDYDYDDLHRLTKLLLEANQPNAPPGSTGLDVTYCYDDVGNIRRQTIKDTSPNPSSTIISPHITGRDWNYCYTSQSGHACHAGSTVPCPVNPAGNSAGPNLPVSIGPWDPYSYDARGSIVQSISVDTTALPGSTYTWDAIGRLATSQRQGGGPSTAYSYDSDDQRIRKQTPAGPVASGDAADTTIYPNPYYTARFARSPTAACESEPCWEDAVSRTKSIYLNGQRIAVRPMVVASTGPGKGESGLTVAGESLYFLHADPVQSVTLITNDMGQRSREIDYLPYGEPLLEWMLPGDPGPPQAYRFDGKELDLETSLAFFGARYLDVHTGRWLSADPLYRQKPDDALSSPAKLNLFAFSFANPVKFMDFDGRDVIIAYGPGSKEFGRYTRRTGQLLRRQLISEFGLPKGRVHGPLPASRIGYVGRNLTRRGRDVNALVFAGHGSEGSVVDAVATTTSVANLAKAAKLKKGSALVLLACQVCTGNTPGERSLAKQGIQVLGFKKNVYFDRSGKIAVGEIPPRKVESLKKAR